ncbi:MAG: LLM class F420-dependent oxidoreductase [Acidimicrobiales bacterium]|nr:MAG: LLM class F420-dependent oxidoreductase [Acidimicrobiales bacterium]
MSRYGITIPVGDGPLGAQREVVRELVDSGYTDLWSAEADGTDGFTPLVLASQWAPEARLGVAVVPVFTRGPACLAQCVGSLAQAAPGRFVLGLGASSDVIVSRWNGIPFEKPYQRVRDTVRFLREAMSGEKVRREYETFSVDGFRLRVLPPEPVPILVAALREGMLRLAGREADGAILNWLSPDDVRKVVRVVEDAAQQAGSGSKEIVARIFVAPSADAESVRAMGRFAVAAYLNVPVYAAFHEWLGRGELLGEMWRLWREGDRKSATAAIPDRVVDDLIVHGPPEACRERIMEYVEAGVDTPVLAILPSGMDPIDAARCLAPR